MKKEKTLSIVALVLSFLAVVGFILAVWIFNGKNGDVLVKSLSCVLIMLAAVCMYVIAVLRDREDDFGCVFFPFFLAALASAVMFAARLPEVRAIAGAFALGAIAAFLTAGVLQVFGKRLVLVSVAVGALVFALAAIKAVSDFATFFLMLVAAAAIVLSIIFYKKNDNMAFWTIVAGVVTLAFLIVSKVTKVFDDYSFLLNMLFMSSILCGLAAIPEALPEEAEELTASETEGTPADRSLAPEEAEEAPAAAEAPAAEAPAEAAPAPYAKWILKRYQNLSAKELMDAPVFALKGVSEGDADLLNSAFGIKTIGDLATNKFFKIADEVFEDTLNK